MTALSRAHALALAATLSCDNFFPYPVGRPRTLHACAQRARAQGTHKGASE